jgi:hypothetical protein
MTCHNDRLIACEMYSDTAFYVRVLFWNLTWAAPEGLHLPVVNVGVRNVG